MNIAQARRLNSRVAYIILIATLVSNQTVADEQAVNTYLALTQSSKSVNLSVLRGFPAVFESFDDADLEKRVEAAYAASIYFNDTLVTLTDRRSLVAYLLESSERTNYVRTRILDVARSSEDFYVRWQLQMSFDVMGNERRSNTVGMTHLRFNEQGKIILHQDFWDSAGGFYQTLPVVGRIISWVRKGLHP